MWNCRTSYPRRDARNSKCGRRSSHSQWWITCCHCIWSLQLFCMLLEAESEWLHSVKAKVVSLFQAHVEDVTGSSKLLGNKKKKKTRKTKMRTELSLNKDSKSTAYPWVSLGDVIWRSPVWFPVKNCLGKDKKMLISPAPVRTWPCWNSRGGFLV